MSRIAERNYTKKPHTARWLMTFHTAGGTNLGTPAKEDTVTDPFANVQAAPAAPVDRRSPAQAALMEKLATEIEGLDAELGAKTRTYIEDKTAAGAWASAARGGDASAWIDKMISKVKELRASQRQAAPAVAEELEDGMYLLDGDVIKVVHAIHGSGRQYGKKLVAPEAPGENGSWERIPGVVNRLTAAHKLDLAKAMELGAIYGCCVRCGRGLTKESSIRQQMGDKCAGSF